MNPVRFGLVGLGNMGALHARNLHGGAVKHGTLAAVCDSDPARLAAYGENVHAFRDLGEMIQSGAIDALVIATPHFAHPDAAMKALNAGLHVLVEKPIAVHKADAERMIAAHAATGGRLQFGAVFNQRTRAPYRKIRHLIQSGELGIVRRVQWTLTDWFRPDAYYASSPWRATWDGEGGGVLINQGPHQLDLWCWLFGLPARVRAFCRFGKYHAIDVEDDVTAYLEMQDGATGTFIISTGEAPGTSRLEIAADRGRLVYEGGQLRFTRNEISAPEFSRTTKEMFGVPPTWDVSIPVTGNDGQHLEILQNFTDAIRSGIPLIAPAAEGLASVELANAMLLSTWLDRTIELPLDGRVFQTALEKRIAESVQKRRNLKNVASS
jgi:predicted dehydrogenase